MGAPGGHSSSNGKHALEHARILVVEDEFIISLELQMILEDAGAEVLGPAFRVSDALALASEKPSCAILDLRLGHDSVSPVAQQLTRLGIPFLFYTGQNRGELAAWPDVKLLSKPAAPQAIVAAMQDLLDR